MKYVITHENGKVIDIRQTELNITTDNIVVVDAIPEFVQQEGYNGILKYNAENGLYWDYELAPVIDPEQAEVDELLSEVSNIGY